MILSIQQLKQKWNKEKDSYLKKEVGDGVQKFVKDCLKSAELFNLKDGLNSTPLEKRKNEFTEESKTKAARKADIIVYINPEILIPIEVERHGNIDAGLGQLLQYQADIDKKYGILTDGYRWRFYNNAYLLKEFVLDEIFSDPDLFLDFWKEYTKPEFYYLSFFEERGQLKILPSDLSVEKRKQDFFNAITTLIRGFENKLKIEGYLENLEPKDRRKKAIEITYAYIIQFILYKTLVDNDFGKFKKEFEEKVEAIQECLKSKQYGKILGIIDGISNTISKNIYRPFAKEQEFITKTLYDLIRKPKNDLHDVSPWLDIFVFIKNYNFAEVKNEIFGYIYENYLKELYEDTNKGQYFTDPDVVNFMLEQIEYTKSSIQKRLENDPKDNYISIIDPSCGSGTFLYSAVDQIIKAVPNGSEGASKKVEELINENIFGLDIAEFPLYLAEMNVLMRMLPLIINEKYNNPIDKKLKVFKTNDSIAEFQDTALKNTQHDADVAYEKSNGQLALFTRRLNLGYTSYVRDEDDLKEMKRSLENQDIPRRRFDFVIGNPPYISYNECSKQKILIFELMKRKQVKLNDIYGFNLHSAPDNRKKYSPKPNLYAFFIALGLALLKDNGKLCYIIPQTVLVNNDLDVIRYHLAKFSTIEKIITFSGKMFIGRGLKQNTPVTTSSLILVVSRRRPLIATHQVEIIQYKNEFDNLKKCFSDISQGRGISKMKIRQRDFLSNVSNWNFINQKKNFLDFYENYKLNSIDFSIYYNHILADSNFGEKFYFDGSTNIPKSQVIDRKTDDGEYYSIPELKSNGFSVKIKGYFPKNKKIKIAEGSQGLIIAEPHYKILWKYINFDKFYYIKGKSILPIYQQYCITSNNKDEITYLLSVLNSKITILILNALLKVRNEEKLSFLLGLTPLKKFIRVPKITESNQFVKEEIIKMTEELLFQENVRLTNLVDFTGQMIQKVERVEIEDNNLVLIWDKGAIRKEYRIESDRDLVEKVIKENFSDKSNKKLFQNEKIVVAELRSLFAVNHEKIKALKDYIDDLVFALYFNVPVKKIGLNRAKEIKKECEKNKFYKLVKS